jgi:hypothetical protein
MVSPSDQAKRLEGLFWAVLRNRGNEETKGANSKAKYNLGLRYFMG